MLVRYRSRFAVSLLFVGLALNVAIGQNESARYVIKSPVAGDKTNQLVPDGKVRLSPDLQIVKSGNGKLIGHNGRGEAVISLFEPESKGRLERSLKAPLSAPGANEKVTEAKRILIGYSQDKGAPKKEQLEKIGVKVLEDYKKGKFLIAEVSAPIGPSMLQDLEATPAIKSVSTDPKIFIRPPARLQVNNIANIPKKALSAPPVNDPEWSKLWGMRSLNAPAAWKSATKSQVVVAIIDTGVDYKHPDLASNMWKNTGEIDGDQIDNDGNGIVDDVFGASFSKGDGTVSGDPADDNSHGTHCAGIIGATGNNGIGVVGVNWEVKIMALKFLDKEGSGYPSDAIKCIDYAIANKAKVLSCSWGSYGFSQEVKDAIDRADQEGIIVVAAAGNDGSDNDSAPHYPSSYDCKNIIAVGAAGPDDGRAFYSNTGKNSVHIFAPGGASESDETKDIYSCKPCKAYQFLAGTSMATPHVSGAVALLWDLPENRTKTNKEIKDVLLGNKRTVLSLKELCTSGAVLEFDLQSPPPPPIGGNARILYFDFDMGEKALNKSGNLLKGSILLAEESDVMIRCSTSAWKVADDKNFHYWHILSDGCGLDSGWTKSWRFSSMQFGESACLSTDLGLRLPKGKHDFYWNVAIEANDFGGLFFDSGSMQIIAVPIAPGVASRVTSKSENLKGLGEKLFKNRKEAQEALKKQSSK